MSNINKIFKPIQHNQEYFEAYLGKQFQLHNTIEWVLKQTGKASVTVLTFSLSEEFVRKVHSLKKQNLINAITVLCDFKAMEKTIKLKSFAENVFDSLEFSKTHAKLVLIENENHSFFIVGSQNATRGNRNEITIISNNKEVYQTFYTTVQNLERYECNC